MKYSNFIFLFSFILNVFQKSSCSTAKKAHM